MMHLLAAGRDDAGARRRQWFEVPISILPIDCEAVVVAQGGGFLREGEARGDARDFGSFWICLPASGGRLSSAEFERCDRIPGSSSSMS